MAKTKTSKTVEITMTLLKMDRTFYPALTALGAIELRSIDALLGISRAKRICKEHAQEFQEVRTKIVEELAKKGKDKKPVVEDGKYVFLTEESEKDAEKRIEELEGKEITISINPISISTLKGAKGLTGNILEALHEFIQEE